jgi:probable rRNA maturation factor
VKSGQRRDQRPCEQSVPRPQISLAQMPARAVTITSRQRTLWIDVRYVRLIVGWLLDELWPAVGLDLGVCFVRSLEITGLNESFLQHKGPTDVITFNYSGPDQIVEPERRALHGEIFICVDEALVQARRFHTAWQSELVRYIVHGMLHLSGYDDRHAADRRRMKRAEDQWLRRVVAAFPVARIGRRRSLKTRDVKPP